MRTAEQRRKAREYMRRYRQTARGQEVERAFDRRRTAKGYYKKKAQRRTESQYHLWRKYRMRQDAFELRLKEQNDCCAACLEPFEDQVPHVDHDHKCCPGQRTCGNCVRGLIHATCNRVLGFMRENPTKLKRLSNYLEESNNESSKASREETIREDRPTESQTDHPQG